MIFPFYKNKITEKKTIWLVDFCIPADFADLRRKNICSILRVRRDNIIPSSTTSPGSP